MYVSSLKSYEQFYDLLRSQTSPYAIDGKSQLKGGAAVVGDNRYHYYFTGGTIFVVPV